MTAETRADGIRHLAGLAGTFPSDALERARKAVGSLVGDAVVAVDGQELIVAAGPATHLDGQTGSALCVVAGPLYDRAELAASLGLPRGTEPDRLVGAAFERWGDEVLTHLRTEATVLVWDRALHRGFVACDPLGASSLFWCREGGAVAFASELRILLALLRRRPAPDPVGIAHWLRRTASRPDLTLYESVAQLRVGHRLRLASEGAAVEPYWRPTYEPPEPLNMEDAVELVRPALRRAVERRLAPAGPTGVLLSGGLDSTAAAGAARAAQAEIRGYSSRLPGPTEAGRERLDRRHGRIRWVSRRPPQRPKPTGLVADTLEFVRSWAAPPDGWGVWNRILFQQAVDDGVSAFLTGESAEALFDVRFSLVGDRLRAGRLVEAFRLTRQVPFGFFYPSPRTVLGSSEQRPAGGGADRRLTARSRRATRGITPLAPGGLRPAAPRHRGAAAVARVRCAGVVAPACVRPDRRLPGDGAAPVPATPRGELGLSTRTPTSTSISSVSAFAFLPSSGSTRR